MIKNEKNWKNFREKLLLKKMRPKNLMAYLYVFKLFSSLRFFKAKKYPFDGFKYLSDVCLKSTLYSLYFLYFLDFFKGISFHLKKVIRFKFIKNKYFNIARIFKEWKKKVYIIRKNSFNDLKDFTKLKFKGKKIEKIKYLEDHEIVDKKKQKRTRLERMYDTNAYFVNTILENRYKLKVKHYSIKRVFKKITKKIFVFYKRSKKRALPLLLKKLAFHLTYIKQKRRKGQKKKSLKRWLRHKYEGKFKEREAEAKKLYKELYTDDEKIKWYLKNRRINFWRKYFLIKKYKRIIFRRKRRTGILHFRMYYSNYYVTLTDLSHNVIFTCSAGSVSSGDNKKTKMSNAVAIPIFFRIIFFLRAFKIRNLKFVFRARMDKMFFIALNFFQKRGYKIKSYSMVHKAPHHLGQRKQKPRRI